MSADGWAVLASFPPAKRTFPEGSRVDVCTHLTTVIDPEAAKVPETVSNSSVVENAYPPETRTFPVFSKVARWKRRAVPIEPVVVHVGSTRRGYSTPFQWTRTVHVGEPGATTGRSHGARGSTSYAQPSTASVAGW